VLPTSLFFGNSPGILRALDDARRYAVSPHPLLILGPRGSGKTVLARYIHQISNRAGEFRWASAALIAEHLEIDALCGHVRGAYTGAHRDKMGEVESAHRGTFFLDELGTASVVLQQILLKLLEEKSVQRLGEERSRPVDVRFIGATNENLEQLSGVGSFRRDLRDRFGHMVIELPSLANRRDEVLPLAERFIAAEAAVMNIATPRLSAGARACLLAARWEGNIRELESVCRYAVLHAHPDPEILIDNLPPDFVAAQGPLGAARRRRQRNTAEQVREALERAGGNKTAAAGLLGISRRHLYRLLRSA